MQGIKLIDGSFAFIRAVRIDKGVECLEIYDPVKYPTGLLLPKSLCKQDASGRWEQVKRNFSDLLGTAFNDPNGIIFGGRK